MPLISLDARDFWSDDKSQLLRQSWLIFSFEIYDYVVIILTLCFIQNNSPRYTNKIFGCTATPSSVK
jgi:hypothetical protein